MTGSCTSPRRLLCSSLRCSAVITPKSISTPATPSTAPTAAVMSVRSLSFNGQPATVSSRPITATPSGRSTTSRTMPSSVIGRRISGSSTVDRAAVIAASTVVAGADMSAMVRRYPRLFR